MDEVSKDLKKIVPNSTKFVTAVPKIKSFKFIFVDFIVLLGILL